MELERKKAALIRAFYYGAAALAVLVCIRYLWGIFLPFLLGLLIACILRPVSEFIRRHSKISATGAAIVSAVVFYALVIAAGWLLGTFLYVLFQNAGVALPRLYSESVRPVLEGIGGWSLEQIGRFSSVRGADANQVIESINAALESIFVSASGWLAEVVTEILKAAPMIVTTLIFTILSSVLICVDYTGVTGFLTAQIPQRIHGVIFHARDFLARAILKTMRAYLILMVITFVLLSLGLWLLDANKFWLVAAVIAVLDLLPVIGSGIILIPWGGWLMISGKTFTGGGLIALWAVISVVRELLEPRIVGGQIGQHPLVTVVSMYAGLRLAGFWGLVLAPIACLLLKYLHDNGILRLYRNGSA